MPTLTLEELRATSFSVSPVNDRKNRVAKCASGALAQIISVLIRKLSVALPGLILWPMGAARG